MRLSREYLLWLPCGLFLVLGLLFITPPRAYAQFGGGTQIVFDPACSPGNCSSFGKRRRPWPTKRSNFST